MRIPTQAERQPHPLGVRALHWSIAGLVTLAWLVGITMEDLPRGGGREQAMSLHYSLGIVVFVLAVLRLVRPLLWPLAHPTGQSLWRVWAAQAAHWALAAITLGLPITGLLDRWARGRPVSVFGGVLLPAPMTIPGGRLWGEAHELVAIILAAMVALHIAAALWHHLALGDGTLVRMLPQRSLKHSPPRPSTGT